MLVVCSICGYNTSNWVLVQIFPMRTMKKMLLVWHGVVLLIHFVELAVASAGILWETCSSFLLVPIYDFEVLSFFFVSEAINFGLICLTKLC